MRDLIRSRAITKAALMSVKACINEAIGVQDAEERSGLIESCIMTIDAGWQPSNIGMPTRAAIRSSFYDDIGKFIPEDVDHTEFVIQAVKEKLERTGDEHHSMGELYRYRMLYNALFVSQLPAGMAHKSKLHDDGKPCFDGDWFIVQIQLPTGQVSNHYKIENWHLFHCEVLKKALPWDGHTPEIAADRMEIFLRNLKQPDVNS